MLFYYEQAINFPLHAGVTTRRLKHPDKTFIGQISKGFDFSGYSFEPKVLSISPKTLANFLEHTAQLSLVTSFGVKGTYKLLNLNLFQE